MNEEEIKEMHKEAREVLDFIKTAKTETMKRVCRNIFKNKWWGIEPEEALKIGGNK